MYAPPPPPPPPPPRPAIPQTSSGEPYGAVYVPATNSPGAARRRTTEVPQPASSYYGSSSAAAVGGYSRSYSGGAYTTGGGMATMTPQETKLQYSHNAPALVFLTPVLTVLWWHSSPYPLETFLFLALALYALDLANDRDATATGIWISFAVLSATNAWCALMDEDDEDDGGGKRWWALQVLRVSVEALLFLCLGCWCTLQFRWLHKETPQYAVMMERMLHAVLPPVSACILSYQFTSILASNYMGVDRAATLAPYMFAVSLAFGMLWLGCCPSSFTKQDDDKSKDPKWVFPSSTARMHSVLLLLVPPLMHFVAFRSRIVSSYASFDEWYDLVLVWFIPYLIHYGIGLLHYSGRWKGPYVMPSSFLFPQSGNTLRGTFLPMVVSVITTLALQQRYLIPWCHVISYQFNGHDLPSSAVVSTYLSLATMFTLVSTWVWGKTSAQTGEPLFGEYQEDIVQLSLCLSGMFVGKAVGMPWTLTPLPVLSFFGLAVWISTRMLRFLAIVLFVVYSAAVVLFSYRFSGIDFPINLSLPGVRLGLIQLGMTAVFASMIVGLVAGVAVRPSGGIGSRFLKRVDAAGILLISYAFVLTALECTLLKQPVPFRDLAGVEQDDLEIDSDAMVYNSILAMLTSIVLVGITWFMKRFKIISGRSAVIVLATAIGKAVAVFIDMHGIDDDLVLPGSNGENQGGSASRMLLRALVATVTLVVMLAPRVFLTPVHFKTMSPRKRGPSGKPISDAPPQVNRTLLIYCVIVLPLALAGSIPLVLNPLIGILSGRYSGAYYTVAPAASELIGFASCLWGASCLSMTNHYLPDGGGDTWKKVFALTFLMGLGVTLAAPTLPDWLTSGNAGPGANPFASISSLGSHIVNSGRSRSGGWGLIAAALAMLLALTGPLELRERQHPSGRKDKSLLLRLMVFSLLFGGGVSLFIVLQSMSEEDFLPVFVTTASCMAMSFFGTIAGVLGYFLELENFDEVEQIVMVWIGSFPVFLLISATSQFVDGVAHPFGIGGWLSTYLGVCACLTLAFSMMLRSRPTKNASTRGVSNLSCAVSWLLSIIILYGRFGVAGLDASYDITLVFGIPASVFGTFLVSPILLALEGESDTTTERRSKIGRLSDYQKKVRSSLALNLKQLNRSNRFAPLVAGTASVFIIASLYVIFFRGCGWLLPGWASVPASHEDLFKGIFGAASRTTAATATGDDVASLAEKNLIHSQAMVTAARLAGSGFWTADNVFGPLLHLGGLLAALPSLYLLLSQMWSGQKIHVAKVTLALPLNLIPLVLCNGIPTLRAAALIGGVGGVVQLVRLRHRDWQSRMTI